MPSCGVARAEKVPTALQNMISRKWEASGPSSALTLSTSLGSNYEDVSPGNGCGTVLRFL